MMNDTSIKAIIHSRKQYRCFLCGEVIPAGHAYVRYTDMAKLGRGDASAPICILCGCLMRRIVATEGEKTLSIRQNGWQEPRVPNCIRKLRTELHRHPVEFVADTERMEKQAEQDRPKPPTGARVYHLLVASAVDVSRRQFFPVPWRLKHYHGVRPGDLLRIRNSINGATYVKTVVATAVVGKLDAAEILRRGEKSLLIRAR